MGKAITPEELAERVDNAYGDVCDLIEVLTLHYDEVAADFDGPLAVRVRELSRRLGAYVNPTVLFVFMAGVIGDLVEELVKYSADTPEDYVAQIRRDAVEEVRAAHTIISEPPADEEVSNG